MGQNCSTNRRSLCQGSWFVDEKNTENSCHNKNKALSDQCRIGSATYMKNRNEVIIKDDIDQCPEKHNAKVSFSTTLNHEHLSCQMTYVTNRDTPNKNLENRRHNLLIRS